jgi:hypothetical protein
VLVAIPLADQEAPLRDVDDAQKKSVHTSENSIALGAAVTLLATFIVNADLSFGNLKQLWQGSDVYVPVTGWTFMTTGLSDTECRPFSALWHPYNNNEPTEGVEVRWYEAGWLCNLAPMHASLSRWMAAHHHRIVNKSTEEYGAVGLPAHSHAIGATTAVNTTPPQWEDL